MIDIPLSQITSPEKFAAEVQKHIEELTNQVLGKPGVPAPVASHLVESVIIRVPQKGPVATRGPDQFIVQQYRIVDDRPVSPEVQVLRDSIH